MYCIYIEYLGKVLPGTVKVLIPSKIVLRASLKFPGVSFLIAYKHVARTKFSIKRMNLKLKKKKQSQAPP
jgi:hypothetical protein